MYDHDTPQGQPPIMPLRRPDAPELPHPVPRRRPRFTPRQERRAYYKVITLAFGLPAFMCLVLGSWAGLVFLYIWAFCALAPIAIRHMWQRWETWINSREGSLPGDDPAAPNRESIDARR